MFPCYCSRENSPASNRGRRDRREADYHLLVAHNPNMLTLLNSVSFFTNSEETNRFKRHSYLASRNYTYRRNRSVSEAVLSIIVLISSRLLLDYLALWLTTRDSVCLQSDCHIRKKPTANHEPILFHREPKAADRSRHRQNQ